MNGADHPTESQVNVGGRDRTSGAAVFVADVRPAGADALHLAFAYSTTPRARIRSVNTSVASAMQGVVEVLTAEEIGEVLVGRAIKDVPVLAVDRVLHVGQRVAAVVATDPATATAGAALVEIDYDDETPVLDASTGLTGRVELHPRYSEYVGALAQRPGVNTQGVWERSVGDVASATAAADRWFDHTFVTRRNHSAPLEPHACMVWVQPERVEVWATNKEPFNLRMHIAGAMRRDPREIIVHLCPLGGDFGSKGFPYLEVACALASARTGRPVRTTMSYYEELTTTAARHATVMRVRTGLVGDRLSSVHVETLLDGGAFAGIKAAPMIVVPVIGAPYGSYDVAARFERCVSVYTNNLPGGHVRSPGEVQALFAGESQIDVIARALGKEPLAFRIEHARDPRVARVLHQLEATVASWRAEALPGTGVGVAACFRDTGPGRTTARVTATRGAGLEVRLSVVDQGAGSYTLFRRLAAEALHVSTDLVEVVVLPAGADDSLTDAGAGASRVTAIAGRAVVRACEELLQKLGPGCEDGGWALVETRMDALGLTTIDADGSAEAGWPAPPGLDVRSHGGLAVQVVVDEETGQVRVLRAHLVCDTGRIINRVAHRGQLEGGFVYGLGQALLEELIEADGAVVTASLGDYRLISAADVPPLTIETIETSIDAQGEAAVLSVGELANVAVAPAIANAICDATDVRLFELPMSPERVLDGLRQR